MYFDLNNLIFGQYIDKIETKSYSKWIFGKKVFFRFSGPFRWKPGPKYMKFSKKRDFWKITKMEITCCQIIFFGWKSHQRSKIISLRDFSVKFLIFWFLPKWRPFLGQNGQNLFFRPKNGRHFGKNQKIKYLSLQSLLQVFCFNFIYILAENQVI